LIYYGGNTAPTGYLKANGALVNRTAYASLFAAIGTTFGVGDNSTTFALPDLRGEFLRGWDDSRGIDVGRSFGTSQTANIASHTHSASDSGHSHVASTSVDSHSHSASDSGHSHGISDPGHFHGMYSPMSRDGANGDPSATYQGTFSGGGGQFYSHPNTTAAGTGISINSGAANVSIGNTAPGASTTINSGAASISIGNTGSGTDTRPRNVAVLICIRYI
jgi:microcystin-dependent protein